MSDKVHSEGTENIGSDRENEQESRAKGDEEGSFSPRRRKLLLSLGGLSILSAGGYYRFFSYPQRTYPPGFKILNSREREICRALFETVLPSGWYSPGDLPRYVKNFDTFIQNLPGEKRLLLRLLLLSVEHSPLVNGFYLKRFSRLSLPQRTEVLRRWQSSPLSLQRFGLSSLLSLLFISYYQTRREFKRIGYPGPLIPPNYHPYDPYIELKAPENFKLKEL